MGVWFMEEDPFPPVTEDEDIRLLLLLLFDFELRFPLIVLVVEELRSTTSFACFLCSDDEFVGPAAAEEDKFNSAKL